MTIICLPLAALLCLAPLLLGADEVFPTVLESFQYPLLGVQAEIVGDVELEVTIARTGEVLQIKRISGHSVLAEAAENAIKKWRFSPTCSQRAPGDESTAMFRFSFQLEGLVDHRPRSTMRYVHPYHVIVKAERLHFQPAKSGRGKSQGRAARSSSAGEK